ncbi:hypothetical protein [Paraburkholderia bryophila]|uniref:Lipoprotein n=1 Tax=Paraburkholderia bryophila TaxID=420952 RepID=A0A7Z0B6I2_9BURK|nr:hypothetical protein [Paraburkholderia bryophila]NYH21367.1 hypothetical protein [Paraburkholderia bryophila]
MKKLMLLAAGVVLSIAFAGCAETVTVATDFQTQVAKACAVVQPTLLSVQAMTVSDPAQQLILGEVVKDNAALCAANASINPTSVSNLVNTSIPAAVQVVGLLPIDSAAKTSAQIGLMAFQVALSAALAQFGAPTAAPAPASGATPS